MADNTKLRERLEMHEAQLLAAEHPHEMVDIMLAAADLPSATAAVGARFGTSEVASRAMIELGFHRLNRRDLQRLMAARDDIKDQLLRAES